RTIASRVRANAAGARSESGGITAQAAGAGGPVVAPSEGSTSSRAGLPLWAQVIGRRGTLDGNGNAKGLRDDTTGLFLGGDATIGQGGWRLGGAVGYTEHRIELTGDHSSSR